MTTYRSLSLTSTCGTMLGHITWKHVRELLNQHYVLSNNQHGLKDVFPRKHHSISKVHPTLNTKGHIYIIFLDLGKLQDKVNHREQLIKLRSILKNQHTLKWFRAFLHDLKQFVNVGEHRSAFVMRHQASFRRHSGIRWGSAAFLLFISDLLGDISVTAWLFANDWILYTEST